MYDTSLYILKSCGMFGINGPCL